MGALPPLDPGHAPGELCEIASSGPVESKQDKAGYKKARPCKYGGNQHAEPSDVVFKIAFFPGYLKQPIVVSHGIKERHEIGINASALNFLILSLALTAFNHFLEIFLPFFRLDRTNRCYLFSLGIIYVSAIYPPNVKNGLQGLAYAAKPLFLQAITDRQANGPCHELNIFLQPLFYNLLHCPQAKIGSGSYGKNQGDYDINNQNRPQAESVQYFAKHSSTSIAK